ncbi:MAG: hypothetical protein HONBIEJF_01414 [Fimbriimonadaceae bacterium]|nr:hypothetical protein [Fimbriimonadaceae bacterium]
MIRVKLAAILIAIFGTFALSSAARAETLLEKIATVIIADHFGIDTREVIVIRDRSQSDIYELAPIFSLSHHGRCDVDRVWQLRRQGLGWGQVAHEIGMHPGTFNKLRKSGAFDRDRIWYTAIRERYPISTDSITMLRRRGGTLEDVLGAVIVGSLSGKPPAQVYDRFVTERSWDRTASYYRVNLDSVAKAPGGKIKSTLRPGNAKVKGKDKSKGKPEFNFKNKSSGNGKGNGKGVGKGNGKSQGKGKGKGKG